MYGRIIMVLLALGAIAVAAIFAVVLLGGEVEPELNGTGLVKAQSLDEVREFLLASEQEISQYYRTTNIMADGMEETVSVALPTGVTTAVPTAAVFAGMSDSAGKGEVDLSTMESSSDYSTTNIQVAGVDEADFVKNDGKYIYIVSDEKLVIVDAYPPEQAAVVSETELDGTPEELFLSGDRLVLFMEAYEEVFVTPASSTVPVPYWQQTTHALVYSVKDHANPVLIRDVEVSGSYYNSRRIGDYVYLLTQDTVRWIGDDLVVPSVSDSGVSAGTPDLYYASIPYSSYLYHTLSAFDITEGQGGEIDAETFLLGYGSTVYVSTSNFYIAYQVPYTYYYQQRAIAETGEGYVDSSVIHRFAIKDGSVDYQATGSVPGTFLNQFSLDEYDGNLRVATTAQDYSSTKGYTRYNNVYVLDMNLGTIGSLENLAEDEQIYAARFIGSRLYLVTFQRIDPLFVIDLSDPQNPSVLGELKIPGYSDYLHPYDENHLIGIGKETEENQWGGVSTTGLKLALFDVSDVANPALLDTVRIGDAGTDSEALYDHRAFLFDREKNLLVIPVRVYGTYPVIGEDGSKYATYPWQGAFVFGVSLDDGFSLRGTVTHSSDDSAYSYWYSPDVVRRSLYIGDALYTVSESKIVVSSLDEGIPLITTVKLLDESSQVPPIYYDGIEVDDVIAI